MVHLRLLRAAYLTRLLFKLASLEVDFGVTAANHLSSLFFGQRFAVRSHPSGMAWAAIGLSVSVTRAAAASASRLLHPFTITDVYVKRDVKHG